MKLKLIALAALSAPLFGAYQYYYTDSLTSIDAGKWTQNGLPVATPGGLSATDANGGSLISTVAVPDSTADYEVAATLKLAASGGTYILYLRASSDTLSGSSTSVGSYFSVEVANPTCVTPSNCAAMVYVYKRISTHVTLLSYNPMPIHNGSMVRAAVSGGSLFVTVDGLFTCWFADGDLSGGVGQPGIGGRQMPAGNSISLVQLGPIDRVAPSAVSSNSIGVTAFPTCVELQWQGASDGPNGIGIQRYDVHRGSDIIAVVYPAAAEDCTVTADGTYTYTIVPIDFHNNYGAGTSFTVRTPAAGAIDPRRVGVNALGTYWGGMGEQIDTRSGNLNYTLPLLSAQGRGGWAVPFALSYNSQMWRKDAGGTWNLGKDVGFGFGWRLLAGSITPYWYGYFGVDHYVFTDSTGAEYRLEINNNNVWTSKQGTYVSYDANSHTLYFPDGSFWTMGCTSTGNEDDAGTLYPTQMTDTNGNIVALRYAAGIGALWSNSSARLLQIEDVRAVQIGTDWMTYQFTYTSDTLPHLTGIQPKVASPEGGTFTYTGQNLSDPFLSASFGSTNVLSTFVNYLGQTSNFAYNGSGELIQANLPYGGTLRWGYVSNTYNSTRTQREVNVRYLRPSAGAVETGHVFYWDVNGDQGRTAHYYTMLTDGTFDKVWVFNMAGATWWNGLQTAFYERYTGHTEAQRYQYTTWTTDPNGTPYISLIDTTLDWAGANPMTTRTTQTIDTHGNLVSSSIYDYVAGNAPLSQPGPFLRTYSNTYITDSNYTSRYIFNRLFYSTVTRPGGGDPVILTTNWYDQYGPGNLITDLTNPAPREHDSSYNTGFLYRGNVTTQISGGKTVTRSYDMAGNIRSASDGNLNVAAATGSATNYAAPSAITPNGNSNLASTYTFNGSLELTGVTMPNGATSSSTYTDTGLPNTRKSPYGATTTYAIVYSNASTATATTNGHWVRSTMDGLGRTYKVEKGDGTTTRTVTESVYGPCACSPMGKVLQVSLPHALNATALYTTYTYDATGRTLTIKKPDNSTTTYVYSGNTTKVTDAKGNWKLFTTDALGNLTKVTEPDPTLGNVDTTYGYNVLGKLTDVYMTRYVETKHDYVTQHRQFTYDDGNQGTRLISARNPENGLVSYEYNSDGTLMTRTDAKGQVVQYSYDSYQRLYKVHRSDGTEDIYTYDGYATSGFTSQNALGRVAAVTFQGQQVKARYGDLLTGTSAFTYMYSYTQAGLVTAKRLRGQFTFEDHGSYAPPDLEAGYTYDDEGRMLTLTYPLSGPTFTYAYNSMGQLNTLAQTAGTSGVSHGIPTQTPVSVVTGATYGVAGELLGFTGTASESRLYNSLFQVTSITSSSGINMQYTYPMDGTNIGKISTQKSLASPNNGEEVQYTYDSLGRMISAQTTAASQGDPWGYSYIYDGFGNLNAKNVTKGSPLAGWAIPADPVTNRAGNTDLNGNLLNPLLGIATYDVENRLASFGGDLYGYDPSNKRIQKTLITGANEIHFYGAQGERLGVYQLTVDIGWSAQYPSYKANLYFGSRHLARFDTWTVEFLGADRLGSENTNMYPWGEEKTTTSQNTEKFATYYRDATGLDYADQRYYSSIMGRFLTVDPTGGGNIEDPQSLNLYGYALGDPTNLNDPSGTDAVPLPPLGPVDQTQCVTVINAWSQRNFGIGYAEYLNTDSGLLGVTSFFEDEGSFAPASATEATKSKAWAAIDYTFINQMNLSPSERARFYGPNAPHASADGTISLFAATLFRGSQVWANGQLMIGFLNQLFDILKGNISNTKSFNDCYGLATSLDVGRNVLQTDRAAHGLSTLPGYTTISDPFPGSLQFASGGVVPGHARGVREVSLGTVDGFTFYKPVFPTLQPSPPRRPRR